jgi:hypothetical protein
VYRVVHDRVFYGLFCRARDLCMTQSFCCTSQRICIKEGGREATEAAVQYLCNLRRRRKLVFNHVVESSKEGVVQNLGMIGGSDDQTV